MPNIRVFISNLGKYNEGELVGDWIDLPATEEELNDLFVELKLGEYDENREYKSGCLENGTYYEDYAIHDYECDIRGFEISEFSSVFDLNEAAEQLSEMNESEIEIIEAYMEADGCGLTEAMENYEEAEYFSNMSPEDVARELLNQRFKIPYGLEDYIDYELYVDELENEGLCETEYGCIVLS